MSTITFSKDVEVGSRYQPNYPFSGWVHLLTDLFYFYVASKEVGESREIYAPRWGKSWEPVRKILLCVPFLGNVAVVIFDHLFFFETEEISTEKEPLESFEEALDKEDPIKDVLPSNKETFTTGDVDTVTSGEDLKETPLNSFPEHTQAPLHMRHTKITAYLPYAISVIAALGFLYCRYCISSYAKTPSQKDSGKVFLLPPPGLPVLCPRNPISMACLSLRSLGKPSLPLPSTRSAYSQTEVVEISAPNKPQERSNSTLNFGRIFAIYSTQIRRLNKHRNEMENLWKKISDSRQEIENIERDIRGLVGYKGLHGNCPPKLEKCEQLLKKLTEKKKLNGNLIQEAHKTTLDESRIEEEEKKVFKKLVENFFSSKKEMFPEVEKDLIEKALLHNTSVVEEEVLMQAECARKMLRIFYEGKKTVIDAAFFAALEVFRKGIKGTSENYRHLLEEKLFFQRQKNAFLLINQLLHSGDFFHELDEESQSQDAWHHLFSQEVIRDLSLVCNYASQVSDQSFLRSQSNKLMSKVLDMQYNKQKAAPSILGFF